MAKSVTYTLENEEQIEKIASALSSPLRRQIIRLSTESGYSIKELAAILNLPLSTISTQVKKLSEAGLVTVAKNPGIKGNNKVVYQLISNVNFNLSIFQKTKATTRLVEVPIGSYSAFEVEPTCGLVNSQGLILGYDNPHAFYSPDRFSAELVYFSRGFIEYTIPLDDDSRGRVTAISCSLELCSEAPMSNSDWKSDITFWLNQKEVGTYHSLGDYGDRMGKNTPVSWPSNASQYGMLVKITINEHGSYINGSLVSNLTIDNLPLIDSLLHFRIGFKDDAKYVGGVNIFGKNFGDHSQNIIFQVTYDGCKE